MDTCVPHRRAPQDAFLGDLDHSSRPSELMGRKNPPVSTSRWVNFQIHVVTVSVAMSGTDSSALPAGGLANHRDRR
ncbi:hypothetical protein [Streptomyces sp. WELS2]|uniref:hypothetical protein n=1 Tax=Streptomyces sp. WELS2 TaxID=2749435 RepID=UPI0015F02C6F|nr:hypothetical protein [Streptomyces sp. WELS2]